MNIFLKLLDTISKPRIAYAHCDVPCGIYDPKQAQIAAATVLRMVEKLVALPEGSSSLEDKNAFARMVLIKEEHARRCKEELLILWTDFFKPEHLQMFPDLHETFWKAAKLCSTNKQHVDSKAAKDLVKAVDDIAKMFVKANAAVK